MSKQHKKFNTGSPSPVALTGEAQAEEYRIIKHDLVKVLIINLLFLAGVLTLYFTNQKNHYLEMWFDRFIRF